MSISCVVIGCLHWVSIILQHANEDLKFEEQILEAAKSIASATSSLVKSASAAQRELVAQGKLSLSNPKSEDGQWSNGLVSAVSQLNGACRNNSI